MELTEAMTIWRIAPGEVCGDTGEKQNPKRTCAQRPPPGRRSGDQGQRDDQFTEREE